MSNCLFFYGTLQARCTNTSVVLRLHAPFRRRVQCHTTIKIGLLVHLHVLFLPGWRVSCECGLRIAGGRFFFPPSFLSPANRKCNQVPHICGSFILVPEILISFFLTDFSMKISIIFNYVIQLKLIIYGKFHFDPSSFDFLFLCFFFWFSTIFT